MPMTDDYDDEDQTRIASAPSATSERTIVLAPKAAPPAAKGAKVKQTEDGTQLLQMPDANELAKAVEQLRRSRGAPPPSRAPSWSPPPMRHIPRPPTPIVLTVAPKEPPSRVSARFVVGTAIVLACVAGTAFLLVARRPQPTVVAAAPTHESPAGTTTIAPIAEPPADVPPLARESPPPRSTSPRVAAAPPRASAATSAAIYTPKYALPSTPDLDGAPTPRAPEAARAPVAKAAPAADPVDREIREALEAAQQEQLTLSGSPSH